MSEEQFHDDIREIRSLVTQNLAETIAIKAAIWPSPGQPSKFDEHKERSDELEKRIGKLEGWRNILNGVWIAITTIASIVFSIHVRGEK